MVEPRVLPLSVVHLLGDFWKRVMTKLMVSNFVLINYEEIIRKIAVLDRHYK